MDSINVSVEYAHKTHNFTLLRTTAKPRYPTFSQICEALVHHLKLRAKPSQLIVRHPPIHVWYRDGDDIIRVRGDDTIREALRKTPHNLRLRVKYRRSPRSLKSDTSAPSHPPTRSDTLDEPEQPSPTALLQLLNHAENHASDATVEAFDELRQSMLKFSGDAANLANARHRLSRLFCSFLRRLSNTPVDDVPDALQERLVSRLGIIFEDEDISEGTVRAARRAVRRMCTDRQALIHMRARWNTISVTLVRVPATPPSTAAPSSKAASKGKSPHRPIKHYQNHVQKLVQVGGSDVKDASKRLLKYIDHHDAINVADPGISTKLCRSIEKVVFHVVLCHKKEGKFVIQSHAARALAASVGRKFERAGFSKRFVSRASSLTRAMVDDPDAVALTYSWAKKRADREASADEVDSGNIRGLAKEDNDELLGGRRDVDDDSTTSSSSGSSSSTSTSSADDDIIGGSRRSRSASRGSHASRRSRSASRSVSRNSRSRSGSRVGSRGRSRSAGKGAQDAGSLRSRSRSRSRSQTGSRRSGRSESRESRASMGRLEEDAEAEIDRRLAEMAAAEEEEEEEESESHSDDEGKIYRYGKVGAAEGSALSDDTDQSQWARVQMEKEKERLRMMYMQDRDLSGDRDGRTQVDVSRRLRSAKDSVARHSARDAPSPSDDEESVVSDEPVRRVGTMRSGHSPQRRRKSKSPFRSDLLQFREVAPQERLVS